MSSEQERPDVKRARAAWKRRIGPISPGRFVFLDESGAQTNMTRQYGRAPAGERVVDAIPGGHWHTTTMISAMRHEGVATAMVAQGATNALVFGGFIEHFLVPVLRPGDIVVMDNLSSHKAGSVVAAIEQAGAEVWYLPPYSQTSIPSS